jgi:hypothetical protein
MFCSESSVFGLLGEMFDSSELLLASGIDDTFNYFFLDPAQQKSAFGF